MQIVVPMSGYGERFRRAGYEVPKPLIVVEGKPIIAHVIDMFPGEADFVFVCNEDHLADPRFDMAGILKRYCPTGRIVPIAAHKLGPVYAVHQARDFIRDDEPVIVNYCDFTCYWNYGHYKEWIEKTGCDGSIPAYRGFHPHSLGSTFYAYLRHNNGWAFDIQEKKPFTDNPHAEYASSGTYHFSSGALMKRAFEETISRDLSVNGEYYVSLAYKVLFDAGMRIPIYELQHFMQWGTPDDLAEYNQQSRAFHNLLDSPLEAKLQGTTLIPMVGAGSRFVAEGYSTPKPLIQVSGEPMVVAAMRDLPIGEEQAFVLRKDMPEVSAIAQQLDASFPGATLVMLEKLTEGQAITCLAAMGEIDATIPLTIGACDNGLLYDVSDLMKMMADPDIDVIVWGYRGHANAIRRPTSYGWIDEVGGHVKGVAVKRPLSDPAHDPVIVGAFTFKRAEDFRKAAERMIARNARVNNEFYVDSCVEDAVALGLNVRLFEVQSYLCWGTPDELRTFEYWQSCFHKWPSHPYRLEADRRVNPAAIEALKVRYAATFPALPDDL